MPSLRCWDSACRLSVSVQSQDSSWSPETSLGRGKDTHWMSYLHPLSVRYSLPYWTRYTPLVELDHLPPPCRRPFVNNPQNVKDPSNRRPKRGSDQSNRRRLAFFIACDPVNVAVLKMSLFIASVLPDFYTKCTIPVRITKCRNLHWLEMNQVGYF